MSQLYVHENFVKSPTTGSQENEQTRKCQANVDTNGSAPKTICPPPLSLLCVYVCVCVCVEGGGCVGGGGGGGAEGGIMA